VTSHQELRIIDASLNRVGEGLRFLEDIARLLLNNTALSQQLKAMRHDLIVGDFLFHRNLLESRDSENDVGKYSEVPGEAKAKELPSLIVANSRRAQEALRTLEEMAKVPATSPELDSDKFKKARFDLYTIERKLVSGMLRQDKLKQLSGLYVIIDTEMLKGRSHAEVTIQVIRGGARVVQLRDKYLSKDKLLAVGLALKSICAERNVLFTMNDYLDIALAAGADGLHLGQGDLPVKAARQLLPLDKILGISTTNVEQAVTGLADGADHVAVGSIYPTSTKETAVVVGLESLRQVRQAVSAPLVAIGGINKDNVADVIAAGADAVAVISGVIAADSPEVASRQIAGIFET